MNLERDSEPALRVLRQSHALLDERPSAATRDRILEAAAARGLAAPRQAKTSGWSIVAFWRELTAPWLAGAAALGLVALLSIGVVLHIEWTKQSEGFNSTKIAIADNATAPVRKEAVPRATVPSSTSSPPQAFAPGVDASGVNRAGRQSVDRDTIANLQSGSVTAPAPSQSTGDAKRESSPEEISAAQQMRATVPPTASDIANNRAQAKAMGAPSGGTTALAAKPESSTLQAATEGDDGTTATQNVRVGGQSRPNTLSYRNNEKAWLERIRELRKSGLNEQADRELKLFVQSHPQAVLPEDLRSP